MSENNTTTNIHTLDFLSSDDGAKKNYADKIMALRLLFVVWQQLLILPLLFVLRAENVHRIVSLRWVSISVYKLEILYSYYLAPFFSNFFQNGVVIRLR